MSSIIKNHFSIDKKTYKRSVLSGHFRTAWDNLSIEEVRPTYEDFKPMLDLVSTKWYWSGKDIYEEETLRTRLAHPETRLFHLKDGDEKVGYALIVSTEGTGLKDRFWKASGNKRVVEIENLALFPGQEGGGRGKAYFEMLFKDLFQKYDVVYWSMSSTNYPTLLEFYKRMGMTLLAQDPVKDFRPGMSEQPAIA